MGDDGFQRKVVGMSISLEGLCINEQQVVFRYNPQAILGTASLTINVPVLHMPQETESASNLGSSPLAGYALGCRDWPRTRLRHQCSLKSSHECSKLLSFGGQAARIPKDWPSLIPQPLATLAAMSTKPARALCASACRINQRWGRSPDRAPLRRVPNPQHHCPTHEQIAPPSPIGDIGRHTDLTPPSRIGVNGRPADFTRPGWKTSQWTLTVWPTVQRFRSAKVSQSRRVGYEYQSRWPSGWPAVQRRPTVRKNPVEPELIAFAWALTMWHSGTLA